MVESTVAEFIADETSFVLGEDIFLSDLFEDTREGLAIRFERNLDAVGKLSQCALNIFLMYYDYTVCRGHVETLTELFDSSRGTEDGSWTVADEVISEYCGKDPIGRYVFVVGLKISYDKSML
jgi:hypothetical protein